MPTMRPLKLILASLAFMEVSARLPVVVPVVKPVDYSLKQFHRGKSYPSRQYLSACLFALGAPDDPLSKQKKAHEDEAGRSGYGDPHHCSRFRSS